MPATPAPTPENTNTRTGRLRAAPRQITVAQRRVLLDRIRAEVEEVVEDITATAASLSASHPGQRGATPADLATVRLIEDEQRRQQLELTRLFGEYESLTIRASTTGGEPSTRAA